MKKRESAAKLNDDGSRQHARGSGAADSASGNGGIPREQWIAEAAYFRAEQRGFSPGNDMSDWLDAEADVDRMLGCRPAA
ncbi:DUF2934 domain-containing protein [Sulfuritalea sp.]|uniref:DUF2934 domain-containing protein n=1 Tax=Sulfuritalea sp. TaxID=2480090 RepID=UPI00286E9A05|nr:DUF2934 domain-containing protein [Sulfuritalea sp.]